MPELVLKRCSRCGEQKPLDEFYADKAKKTGKRAYCIPCGAAYNKELYAKHREARIESTQKWKSKNYARALEYQRVRRAELRNQVLDGYGARCACCGETIRDFLTVEHLNRDGRQHRERVGGSVSAYLDIVRRGFPSDITLLCMNCNYAKRYTGVCPHEVLALAKGEQA